MKQIKDVQWPLVIGLGALALVRPLVRIVEDQLEIAGSPAVPIAITAVISALWIAVVGLGKTARPVLTLLFTALTYAVLSIALSGILSPILDGEIRGPLANPMAIIPVLAINAFWGLAAGALALLVQHVRGTRSPGRIEPR